MAIVKNAMMCALVLVAVTLCVGCVVGTTHKVGDSEGWAPGADYYTWVTSRHFEVGDSLVFEYNKDFHDVTQLSDPLDFEFCDLSSTVARYKTGYDVVNLTRPGRYYFVCGAPGHCKSGQRFDILVTSTLPPDVVVPTTQPLVAKSPSPSAPLPNEPLGSTPSPPVANAPLAALSPLHNAASASPSSSMGSISISLASVLLPQLLL